MRFLYLFDRNIVEFPCNAVFQGEAGVGWWDNCWCGVALLVEIPLDGIEETLG